MTIKWYWGEIIVRSILFEFYQIHIYCYVNKNITNFNHLFSYLIAIHQILVFRFVWLLKNLLCVSYYYSNSLDRICNVIWWQESKREFNVASRRILCTHNYYLTLYYLLAQKMCSRNYIIFQQTCALSCFRAKYPSNCSKEAYHTSQWHRKTNLLQCFSLTWNINIMSNKARNLASNQLSSWK